MKFEIMKVLEDFELLVVLRRSLWTKGKLYNGLALFIGGRGSSTNALLASPEAL
jgi:hypothetical protein